MKHLSEEQLIDVLMEESHDDSALEHLAECDPCTDRLVTLETGLTAARSVKPRMPLTAVPVISFDKFTKQTKSTRLTWLGVAAMLFLAITGFRMEIGERGMVIQFALFHGSAPTENAQEMEQRLTGEFMDALEVQAIRMQNQMDSRLDTFYLDQDQENGEFSRVVNRNLTHYNLENERKLIQLEQGFVKQQRKSSKGQWQ